MSKKLALVSGSELNDPNLKKSTLYCLSNILKRWKKKEFVLNLFNNSLLIRTKGKEKLLYLKTYSVKILGKFKKKLSFCLESTNLNERRYIIGCDHQELFEVWAKALSNISNYQKNQMFDNFHLQENREGNDLTMKKSSPLESCDDFYLTNSSHDGKGNSLSPYENFLAKEELMSSNFQKKDPMSHVPSLLIDQYKELVANVKRKDFFHSLIKVGDEEEWEMKYSETYYEKVFRVFVNKKHHQKGRMIIKLNDKYCKDIYKELKDPEYSLLWDQSLLSVEFKTDEKTSKCIRINEIYKPSKLLSSYQELDFVRIHGKEKNYCFFIWKSTEIPKDEFKDVDLLFSHTKYQYESIKDNLKKCKVNKNSMLLFDEIDSSGQPSCYIVLDVDMFFLEKEEEKNQNQKIIQNYLRNFKGLHKLLIPLCQLKDKIIDKEEKEEDVLARKQEEVSKKDRATFSNKKEKRGNYIFHKGNAELYANKENLAIFYEYFKSGEYIYDCINNYHEMGFKNTANFIETNETQGHFAFKKDYRRGKNGGLDFLNVALMEEQKKVIISLIKQAGSNIIHGRSFMNVSLPLEVFEPRSFLERLARSFGHAPDFLERAGQINSVQEQVKLTLSFFMSSLILCIQQEKPFNPILGETFQARIAGLPIYLEQISHHPPITAYLLIGKSFVLSGTHEPVANLTPNTVVAEQKGSPYVYYKNTGTKIYFRWPTFVINGSAVGRRYLNFTTRALCYEPNSALFAELLFNASEITGFSGLFQRKESFSIDEVSGGLYKVKPETIVRYQQSKKPFKLSLEEKDIIEVVGKIRGEWTGWLEVDNKRYWDIAINKPYICEYEENPLPSDGNFRADVILMRLGKRGEAQMKKNEGEMEQRYDKKLRENYKKKKKDKKKKKEILM